jgi:hypothetical protein
MQLLGAALLVSPFFFWGTSMVAMKVGKGSAHNTSGLVLCLVHTLYPRAPEVCSVIRCQMPDHI